MPVPLDVSVTLPPVQNVVAPLAETVGAAGDGTVSVAAFDVADPQLFVNTARYCLPLSAADAVNVYVVKVAFAIGVNVAPPSLDTCQATVAVRSFDAAVNVACDPLQNVADVGLPEIAGALLTVRAAVVCADPATLLKRARY